MLKFLRFSSLLFITSKYYCLIIIGDVEWTFLVVYLLVSQLHRSGGRLRFVMIIVIFITAAAVELMRYYKITLFILSISNYALKGGQLSSLAFWASSTYSYYFIV